MIVDIEDVIEETASPLRRVQPHQTPVYSVAASETTSIAVPLGTVTSSHEPSSAILMEVEDDPNREHWESSWNLRANLSIRNSSVPGNWLPLWGEKAHFSAYDNTNPEFEEDRHRRLNHCYQHVSDQKTWQTVDWNKTTKYPSDYSFELTQNEQSFDDNEGEYNRMNLKR